MTWHNMYYQTLEMKRRGKERKGMKVETQGQVMLMSTGTRETNGKVYYNADIYDLTDGALYHCSITGEIFATLANSQKPVTFKKALLDVRPQYQGASRIELIGWS